VNQKQCVVHVIALYTIKNNKSYKAFIKIKSKMQNQNPVYFYYWSHDLKSIEGLEINISELMTGTFTGLIRKSDVLFKEYVCSNQEIRAEIEDDFNNYIKKGLLPLKLEETIATDEETSFLLNLMKGTNKRVLFERSNEAPFDWNEEEDEVFNAFFRYPLNYFKGILKEYLTKTQNYSSERDKNTAEQIINIPETTLVLFGAGHPEIAEIVSSQRKTEIHFPYEDYPASYETQMTTLFRKTGEASVKLYAREIMERLARKATKQILNNETNMRKLDLIASHYASSLTFEKIVGYTDYLSFAKTIYLGGGNHSGDIFESWLKKEKLPLPQDIKIS